MVFHVDFTWAKNLNFVFWGLKLQVCIYVAYNTNMYALVIYHPVLIFNVLSAMGRVFKNINSWP